MQPLQKKIDALKSAQGEEKDQRLEHQKDLDNINLNRDKIKAKIDDKKSDKEDQKEAYYAAMIAYES
jgi:predicted  nucleic acid-binding Zn-ribbon protein